MRQDKAHDDKGGVLMLSISLGIRLIEAKP